MKNYLTIAALLTLLFAAGTSCKKKPENDPLKNVKGNFFSIRQFGLDEWNSFEDMPFLIRKTINIDGHIDSSLSHSDTINWTPIFKTFFETDISDRKNLDKYKFTQFDDDADRTHNFFYEANDDELFTQKLLITIDQRTSQVKGIYIETLKKGLMEEQIHKLYYAPLKTIQIQTQEKPLFGDGTRTVLQYEFMR